MHVIREHAAGEEDNGGLGEGEREEQQYPADVDKLRMKGSVVLRARESGLGLYLRGLPKGSNLHQRSVSANALLQRHENGAPVTDSKHLTQRISRHPLISKFSRGGEWPHVCQPHCSIIDAVPAPFHDHADPQGQKGEGERHETHDPEPCLVVVLCDGGES